MYRDTIVHLVCVRVCERVYVREGGRGVYRDTIVHLGV